MKARGLAGAGLPAGRSRRPAAARRRRRLGRGDPVRRVLRRPPRRRARSSRSPPPRSRGSRFAGWRGALPRGEAGLRGSRSPGPTSAVRRSSYGASAVSSAHAGRGRTGRGLHRGALLRRVAAARSRRRDHARREPTRRRGVQLLRLHAVEDAAARAGAPARGVAHAGRDRERARHRGDLRLARLGHLGLGRRRPGRSGSSRSRSARARRGARGAAGRRRSRRRRSSSTTGSSSRPARRRSAADELEGTEVWTTNDATSSHEVPAEPDRGRRRRRRLRARAALPAARLGGDDRPARRRG